MIPITMATASCFREWTVGAQVTCWHDPHDLADVVVRRGFGGAYLFPLPPLFPFLIGWRILRGSSTGHF